MIRLDKVVNILNTNRFNITRRTKYIHPVSNMIIFMLPLLTYVTGKMLGVHYNEREWLFPVVIFILFIFWFFINYKFVKR